MITLPTPLIARLPAPPRALPASGTTSLPADGPLARGKSCAVGLRAAPEADLDRAVRRLTAADAPAWVACYVLAGPSWDLAGGLARAQAVINRCGRQARGSTYAGTGMTAPVLRPHMARLGTAISHGELHGIVVVFPEDISVSHKAHARALAARPQRAGVLHARAR